MSPDFYRTYKDAIAAIELGLVSIVGPGLRRALEFLVKDYSGIGKSEAEQEVIRRLPLAQCIKAHIQEDGIKVVAERAAWLGNDESHYVRKWADKDLSDFHNLVKTTIAWIDIHLTTEALKASMPGPAGS